ncbi:hypothetical protein NKH74_10665 [Mesorhizobium sp. M0933]|uniref:lysozyme n=1 Tax=Mesorhizobium sp. M0933 TaxID=2957030 RepID=UPI0033387C4F
MADDVLQSLAVTIEARTAAFEKALNRIEKQNRATFSNIERDAKKNLSGLEAAIAKTSGTLRGLGVGDALGNLKGQTLAVLAPVALLTAGIAGAKKALGDFGKLADDIKPTGLSPEVYQALGLGAREAGVDVDGLNAALNIFAKNSGLAAAGQGPLISGLKALNPELLKAILNAKDQDERLRLVADALGKTTDASSRAALAATVFGRSGVQLVDIFTGGSKAIDGFIERGHEMGIIISGEMLGNVDALSDKLDVMSFAIETNVNAALINMAPLLVGATTEIAHLTKGVKEFTEQPSFETFVRMLELTNPKIVAAAQGIDSVVDSLAKGTPEAQKLASNIKLALTEIPRRLITDEQLATLDSLKARLGESGDGAQSVKEELAKLAESNPKFRTLADQLDPLLDKLIEIQKQAGATGAALGAVGGSMPNWRQAEDQSMADLGKVDAAGQAVLDKRDVEARRTEFEKQVQKRADDIVAAMAEGGGIITRGNAELRARTELASEASTKASTAATASAVDLIKQFEGFISTPKFDVNAYRAGFGSDTVTLADGSVEKVTAGIKVGLADANRDLVRRVGEFQEGIRGTIGADTFNSMNESQQAALTSIAYNYGSLPDRIVDAIKTGNAATVVGAIRGLGTDNGGINKGRRNQEADAFLSGAPAAIQTQGAGQDSFKASLADIQTRIDAIKAETAAQAGLNPLVNDYGYAVTKAQVAQDLLNDAQSNGVEITPELRANIDQLAGKYAAAKVNADQLRESQGKITQAAQEFSAFGKDVFGGFIKDLASGKTASEALADALQKVIDKLLEIALNAIFDGPSGAGGGIFGSLFAGIGHLFGFDDGGYTGGKKDQVRGFVHGEEFVVRASEVAKPGVRQFLEGLNNNKLGMLTRGFAKGGYVGPSAPALSLFPGFADQQRGMHITVGWSRTADGNLKPFIETVSGQTAGQVVSAGLSQYDKNLPARFGDIMERNG